jgi:hypothetical protein
VATSTGEWFFYAVCTLTFGYVVVGTFVVWIRAAWELVRRLFESDDPH